MEGGGFAVDVKMARPAGNEAKTGGLAVLERLLAQQIDLFAVLGRRCPGSGWEAKPGLILTV
jgi:hypothetical protein